jgi:glutamine cyclotransferase
MDTGLRVSAGEAAGGGQRGMMKRLLPVTSSLLLLFFSPGLAGTAANREGSAPIFGYRIVGAYPHDRRAFTQGLLWSDGELLEGTGLYGKSSLRRVDLRTGQVLQNRRLAKEYFGEGVTLLGRRIFQLTWRAGKGFVYDRDSFDLLETFTYQGEGWGLTTDGSRLIMSDGTDTLRFLDPESLSETGRLPVRDGAAPVTRLNELEYVRGEIYANVWMSDRIAVISPESGRVIRWIDLRGILSPIRRDKRKVLNGIAFDPQKNRLFVTGKLWPRLFEIEITPP